MSRIDKSKIPSTPAIQTPSLELQLADRTQAISAGGLCPIMQMIKTLDLRYHINSGVSIFKVYAPYDEADHVLNIALNLLAGGTCLDHLEIRRIDEAHLNALGAQRIPDPTTAGDFCRRFDEMKILMLMQAINKAISPIAWSRYENGSRRLVQGNGCSRSTPTSSTSPTNPRLDAPVVKWSSGPTIVVTRRTPSVNFMHPERWPLRLII